MDEWDKFLKKSIEDNKEAKQQSKEDEIYALQNSDKVSGDLIQEILDQERDWREYLDEEIKGYREWLMDRKEA